MIKTPKFATFLQIQEFSFIYQKVYGFYLLENRPVNAPQYRSSSALYYLQVRFINRKRLIIFAKEQPSKNRKP